MNLLRLTTRRALIGTAASDAVAAALCESGAAGITSPFRFDEKGDVVGKRLVTAVVRGGRFE